MRHRHDGGGGVKRFPLFPLCINEAAIEKGIVSMQLQSLIPMLNVVNVEKSIAFYQDALDFDVLNRYEHDGCLQWAMVKSGETELMLAHCDTSQGILIPATKEDLVLYFYPDDVEALHTSLQDKGYPVSDLRVTLYSMKECDLIDPDGYQFSFGQETDEPSSDHGDGGTDDA